MKVNSLYKAKFNLLLMCIIILHRFSTISTSISYYIKFNWVTLGALIASSQLSVPSSTFALLLPTQSQSQSQFAVRFLGSHFNGIKRNDIDRWRPLLPSHPRLALPCSVLFGPRRRSTQRIFTCICICSCAWLYLYLLVRLYLDLGRGRCASSLFGWLGLVTIQLMRLRAREFWIRIQARLLFQCWLANYRNFCMKLDYFKIVTNKLIAHYAQTATWHSPLFALYFAFFFCGFCGCCCRE